MKTALSIRYKFLFVTTFLLVVCVGAYLALASRTFLRDKTELIFDLNRSVVTNLSSELETQLRGVADKMKLIAMLYQDDHPKSAKIMSDLFNNDADIVFAAASMNFHDLDKTFFQDEVFGQTYGIGDEYYTGELLAARPIPFQEIRVKGEAIWNATIEGGPPLIGFGKNVITETDTQAGGLSEVSTGTPFALIAYVRADKLLKAFGTGKFNEVFAVNADGEILIHPVPEKMQKARKITGHPLMKLAKSQPVKTGVAEYQQGEEEWLGAYSTSFNGRVLVMSQVLGRQAFSVVTQLLQRSVLFAMILLTMAFIAAILFSRTLTQPIQSLVAAMKRVSEGDLKSTIQIRSRDEIKILGDSFNSMIADLRDSREKLEEINRDLEQKVKDRTRKLEEQNQTVKRQQEALLQSTRFAAVGEIAGRAAHEVLNPLTGILNRLEKVRTRVEEQRGDDLKVMAEIISAWEKDHEQGGFNRLVETWQTPSQIDPSMTLWQEDLRNLKGIRSENDQDLQTLEGDVDFLIKEGLRINRIVQGMRQLTAVKADLKERSAAELLHESVNVMADHCSLHNISIEESYEAGHDTVRVDSDEFIQCVTNLIRNSTHAIVSKGLTSGTGRITVASKIEGQNLHIDVSDNGIGIPPENQGRLFESQFSTKPIEEGTGLGLSISRRFMRAFGGDLQLVSSVPGENCLFRIVLPLSASHESNEQIKRMAS